jgi:hypothetical protein
MLAITSRFQKNHVFVAMVRARAMATATTAMIDRHSFHDSNGTIAAIIYILFIFNENATETLWAMNKVGGERGIVGWFL